MQFQVTFRAIYILILLISHVIFVISANYPLLSFKPTQILQFRFPEKRCFRHSHYKLPPMASEAQSPATFPQALQQLAKGKSLLAASDYEAAVQAIGEALEMATRLKGELDTDLGDFYYANGNALLCRYEESVQDQVLPGEPLQEVVLNQEINCADAEIKPVAESGADPEAEIASAGSESAEEVEENKAEEDASDVDELQLAWENLETARVIYLNSSRADELIKVHVRLGDLEVIRQSYLSAEEEYHKALNLMDTETPSRKLAEVYYLLGSTNLAVPEHESEAVEFFDKAMVTLDQLKSESRETIEGLIKEIREKREDAVEQAQSYKVIKESFKAVAGDVFTAPQNPGGPVLDLGVVKRKREEKPEEDGDKKPKLGP